MFNKIKIKTLAIGTLLIGGSIYIGKKIINRKKSNGTSNKELQSILGIGAKSVYEKDSST